MIMNHWGFAKARKFQKYMLNHKHISQHVHIYTLFYCEREMLGKISSVFLQFIFRLYSYESSTIYLLTAFDFSSSDLHLLQQYFVILGHPTIIQTSFMGGPFIFCNSKGLYCLEYHLYATTVYTTYYVLRTIIVTISIIYVVVYNYTETFSESYKS